jgi:hypothetical protein
MAVTYHDGERAVQVRAGLHHAAEHASGAIGTRVPSVAAEFLHQQPLIVLGAIADDGRTWATGLVGEPGFINAVSDQVVTIAARPAPGDPLAEPLQRPTGVGMIAIEPATRRRMRINGRSHPDGPGLRVEVHQVYANCPKYIQKRSPIVSEPTDRQVARGDHLSPDQMARVGVADTFFVATSDGADNVDASHRGGNSGFLRPLSPTRLEWPDYVGNAMFMTLGNITVHPPAGLLIPDWSTGSTLQLTGHARLRWGPDRQRTVEFEITGVVDTAGASPWRWSAPAYSRFNPEVTT